MGVALLAFSLALVTAAPVIGQIPLGLAVCLVGLGLVERDGYVVVGGTRGRNGGHKPEPGIRLRRHRERDRHILAFSRCQATNERAWTVPSSDTCDNNSVMLAAEMGLQNRKPCN